MTRTTGRDLNVQVQLERLVAYRADGSVSPVVVAGRLSPDGVFSWAEQPGPPVDGAGVQEGVTFAAGLAGTLASVTESSDTDTPFVPFVLSRAFTPGELERVDWLGLLPLPTGEVEVEVRPSDFRLAERLARREADGNAADFYAPGEAEAIRAAEAVFMGLTERRLVTVTAGRVALLLIDVARLPLGTWAGVASLRIDT
ncbi:hypothetical protein [Deinococcus aquiradiocola]|uniref:Uncharacterized protein n=1 Tax=Deinococcus aquiradiocola TaxID=393059 RepID=A0A917PJP0_9DEIO|nr:hypothetical protein [Deinococcus aquiradiocola]GGJ81224.1 hypothetical protein GCM10008939_26580 [Deinococcus aquiradiocola]